MTLYKQIILIFLFSIDGISAFSQKDNTQAFVFSNNVKCNSVTLNYINDRIYIPVTIENGIECNLFLDSGINNVLLDSSFIARNRTKLNLAINSHNKYYYTSIDGNYRFYPTLFIWKKNAERKQSLKIQIGNSIVFEEHPIASGKRDDAIASGIFPLHLLAKDRIANIDVEEKKITLLDKIDNKSDSIHFEMDPSTSAPSINTSIRIHANDTSYLLKGPFLLDLGFRGDLVLSESVLKNQLNKVPNQEFSYASATIGNVSTVKESYNISLDIDNIHTKNATIVYSKSLPPNIRGIIGMGILKHLNFAVDYHKHFFHYHMEYPFIQNAPRTVDEKSFGINLIKKSSLLYIGRIRKGGKADLLGVKVLDRVIKVEDQYVTKENCDQLLSKLPVSKIIIQSKKGNIITLQK